MYFLLTKDGFLVYNGSELKYQRGKSVQNSVRNGIWKTFSHKNEKLVGGRADKGVIPRKIIEKRITGCCFVGK